MSKKVESITFVVDSHREVELVNLHFIELLINEFRVESLIEKARIIAVNGDHVVSGQIKGHIDDKQVKLLYKDKVKEAKSKTAMNETKLTDTLKQAEGS